MKNQNCLGYLSRGAWSGIQLGIFLWLVEISIIIWEKGNLSFIFEDSIISQFVFGAIIYSFIGILWGLFLGLLISVFQFLRKREFLSLACLNVIVFCFITGCNILYLWFKDISKVSFISQFGLILFLALLALLLGYFIYNFNLRKLTSILYSQGSIYRVLFTRKNAGYLFLVLIIFTLSFITLSYLRKNTSKSSTKNSVPSIIVILIDTLRADHLSCYGHPDLNTNNIDRLAKESILFTNAYSQAPWTRPSVATLLTALYPSSHGVNSGGKRAGNYSILSEQALTLPEYLKKVGYYTAGFSTNPSITKDFGFTQGYDEYYFLNRLIIRSYSLFEWMIKIYNVYIRNYFYVNAETLVDKVSEWLTTHQNRPFFLYLHFMDPHRPYFHEPEKFWTKSDSTYRHELIKEKKENYLDSYKNEIEFVDYSIGKLIQQLKKINVYDNSIIIFTSDHGEEFLEHGGWDHGHTLYDELLRVPLIIKLPNLKKGKKDHRLIRLMDIFPTIVEILKLNMPSGIQGEPCISSEGEPLNNIPFIFAERLPAWKGQKAIRNSKWKLILSHDTHSSAIMQTELYNMMDDPLEKKERSLQNEALVNELRSKIEEISAYTLKHAIYLEKVSIDKSIKEQLKTLGYTK